MPSSKAGVSNSRFKSKLLPTSGMDSGYAPILQESQEVEYEMEQFIKNQGGRGAEPENKAD